MKNKLKTVLPLLLSLFLLASCAQRRVYLPAESTAPVPASSSETTPEPTTAPKPKKFQFFGIEMGMNTAMVQAILGQERLPVPKDGKYFFTNGFTGIPGLAPETEKTVSFVFSADDYRLEAIQYSVKNSDGLTYEQSIELFKKQFRKPVFYKSELGRDEAIWFYRDVYVVLTKLDENTTVVSYLAKTLFEEEYKEKLVAYRNG